MENAFRVALVRHPIDRVISHYYFWKHAPVNRRNPLWCQLLEEDRDIIWFAETSLIQGFYCEHYFKDVDMRQLDLVIDFPRIKAGVGILSNLIGESICLRLENTTQHFWPGYDNARRDMLNDAALVSRLSELLCGEIAFYESTRRLTNVA
jgi:hypothetical protein